LEIGGEWSPDECKQALEDSHVQQVVKKYVETGDIQVVTEEGADLLHDISNPAIILDGISSDEGDDLIRAPLDLVMEVENDYSFEPAA
jgi:hypothetical protein